MVTVYRRRLNSCNESSSFGHRRLTNVVEGRWRVLQRPSRFLCAVTACVVMRGVETRVGAGQAARTHSYVSDARRAHASLGDTVTTVSVIPTGPGAAGVISPNFFLFVTTIGVIVS